MQPDDEDRGKTVASARVKRLMRVSYACIATAALLVAASGVSAVIRTPAQARAVAAVSIVAHESDHIEAPESHTAGFSGEASRFTESSFVQVTERTASVYSATTA